MDESDSPIGDGKTEPTNGVNTTPEASEQSTIVTETMPDNPAPKKSRFKLPKIKWNRNTALVGSLAILLLMVGVLTLFLTRGNNTEESQNEVVVEEQEEIELIGASILIDEGTIQIVSEETGEWQDADTTTVIEQGAELRTVGATSRAVIGFDDGSALRLDANSEVVLEEMTTERIVIKHVSGYTYNRVLPSDSLTYVVTSKDAQYEALGTAFRTASTGDEQSVEVFHSSVIETNTNKTPKEGEKLIVENRTAPTENGTIKRIDIEQVKNDPFMEWNRELDINDDNYKQSLGFLSDITAPDITLNKNDGDVVLLEPNASEGTIEISGKTESGAKLTAQSKSQPGSSPIDVTVEGDGSFKTPVLTAPIGNSVFEFIATDRVGNKSTKTLRITFQRKSQPVAGNAQNLVISSNGEKDGKLQISWVLNGSEAKDGFKVVYEKDNSTPIFGQGDYESYPVGKDARESSIDIGKLFTETGTYYVKVCIYDKDSGKCGLHSSNSIKYVKS